MCFNKTPKSTQCARFSRLRLMPFSVKMGYNEPHPPFWAIAYWVFILEYYWNTLNKSLPKNLEKSWKFSSQYYVMVYIKKLLQICHFQKNSSPFTSPFSILKHWYNVFKVFLGICHSLDWFQTFRVYIPIHWK